MTDAKKEQRWPCQQCGLHSGIEEATRAARRMIKTFIIVGLSFAGVITGAMGTAYWQTDSKLVDLQTIVAGMVTVARAHEQVDATRDEQVKIIADLQRDVRERLRGQEVLLEQLQEQVLEIRHRRKIE